MAEGLSVFGWPMTGAAVLLALGAWFVGNRLASWTRLQHYLLLGTWSLAILLFLVSQLLLAIGGDASVMLVVQQEAQTALGWLLATVFSLGAGWTMLKTLRKTRDILALVVWIALTLGFGFFAVRDARAFWLDAFTPPIRVEGRVHRLWTEGSYSVVGGFIAPRVPYRINSRFFREAYVSVHGRTIQVTWDVYWRLKVGQRVAFDVGRGSGRAIAVSM